MAAFDKMMSETLQVRQPPVATAFVSLFRWAPVFCFHHTGWKIDVIFIVVIISGHVAA